MRNPYRKHIGSAVVVQTAEATLIGDLVEAGSGVLTLRKVLIGEQHGQTGVDGLVLVPLTRVCWIQVT